MYNVDVMTDQWSKSGLGFTKWQTSGRLSYKTSVYVKLGLGGEFDLMVV